MFGIWNLRGCWWWFYEDFCAWFLIHRIRILKGGLAWMWLRISFPKLKTCYALIHWFISIYFKNSNIFLKKNISFVTKKRRKEKYIIHLNSINQSLIHLLNLRQPLFSEWIASHLHESYLLFHRFRRFPLPSQ